MPRRKSQRRPTELFLQVRALTIRGAAGCLQLSWRVGFSCAVGWPWSAVSYDFRVMISSEISSGGGGSWSLAPELSCFKSEGTKKNTHCSDLRRKLLDVGNGSHLKNITCIHEIRDSHPGSILTSRDPEIHLSIVAQCSQQEAFLLGLAKRHGCLHIEQEFCTISDVEEHW